MDMDKSAPAAIPVNLLTSLVNTVEALQQRIDRLEAELREVKQAAKVRAVAIQQGCRLL